MSTVLVVEDDDFIRMDAASTFEEAGYTVIEAANADDAIRVLETQDVEVLFTDIEMPGSIDGLELASLVSDRWPEMRIVIASGKIRLEAGQMPEKARFLTKPYSQFSAVTAVA